MLAVLKIGMSVLSRLVTLKNPVGKVVQALKVPHRTPGRKWDNAGGQHVGFPLPQPVDVRTASEYFTKQQPKVNGVLERKPAAVQAMARLRTPRRVCRRFVRKQTNGSHAAESRKAP